VRNRLGYEKLHKLVYVHYNLQLRVQQIEGKMKERELDPCGMMLNATLYDNANPTMDWLTNSRSESEPLLDADDYDEDAAAAYEDDYNNHLPTPTHDVVVPVLIEEPPMRPINKRKTRTVNAPVIEEEDEEVVEAESDDDMEDNRGEHFCIFRFRFHLCTCGSLSALHFYILVYIFICLLVLMILLCRK
jgi:hypothetical protein